MENVGLLIIATNKYFDFVEPLLESARKYFLSVPGFNVVPFVFTDQQAPVSHGAIKLLVKHRPWPMTTLLRFRMFLDHRQDIEKMDYLFYCDADMRFVDKVGEEVLGTTVGTIHPLRYDTPLGMVDCYENRPESKAYLPPEQGQRYYMAAFFGGRTENFIDIATELAECIDTDLSRGIIAKWHDESHLNRYFADHPPSVELPPSYCYLEGMSFPFKPVIVSLKKDYAVMRGKESVVQRWLLSIKHFMFRNHN